MRRVFRVGTALCVISLALGASPAWGAFPGFNGRITFVTALDDEEIFDVGADGSQQRNLTNNSAHDFTPAYSPDGRRIAFGSFRAWDPLGGGFVANSGELYVMNADGSNVRRVTVNAVPDGYPAWSPDGERLVFARPQRQQLPDEDLPPTDLWIVNLTTGEERELTDTPVTDEIRPQWSPDGQQIAFESDALMPDDYDVYTIRADGRDLRRLTRTSGFDGEANYSPDGGHIVFSSERSGNSDIFVMRSDGGRQTQLTTDRHFDALSCFSPDGRYIAFTSERDGHRVPGGGFFYPDIFRMRADGSQQTNLTMSPSVANFDPDWQPLHVP